MQQLSPRFIPHPRTFPSRIMGGWIIFLLAFTLQSCAILNTGSQSQSNETYYQVSNEIVEDPEIAALLSPYITQMKSRMNQVIAYSETEMTRGQPEGILGNMSADIVRFRAIRELGKPVQIGVVNNGGLRVPLPQGDITVGHIFELMPFENTISVLTLSGDQVQRMADQLAAIGGEAVSGIRFRINNGKATDILVNYEPLNPDRTYLVATNNYMADGGGPIEELWRPIHRVDIDVLIRDAMIEYLRSRRHLNYELEQRIRITED